MTKEARTYSVKDYLCLLAPPKVFSPRLRKPCWNTRKITLIPRKYFLSFKCNYSFKKKLWHYKAKFTLNNYPPSKKAPFWCEQAKPTFCWLFCSFLEPLPSLIFLWTHFLPYSQGTSTSTLRCHLLLSYPFFSPTSTFHPNLSNFLCDDYDSLR